MSRRMVLHGLGADVALELLEGDLGAKADAAMWADLGSVWARCRVDDATPVAGTVTIKLEAGTGAGAAGADAARSFLMVSTTQQVTQALISARRGELLMLHAGGVAHPVTGRSLVFVAAGGTGKSTLSQTLGREYSYLSDETIGIAPDGLIHPYLKPISMRPLPGESGPKRELAPASLGLLRVGAEPRLHRIILLRRDPDASGFNPEPLATIPAIEALVTETSSLGRLPRALHVVQSLLSIGGGAERWTYAEHSDLLPAAREILGVP